MDREAAFHNTTVLHPVGLAAVLVMGVCLLLVPRRYAFLPMLVVACFIPSAQRLVIAGADFNLLRLLILFGWFRLLARNEFKGFLWNKLDTLVVAWMVGGTVIYLLRMGTPAVLIYRCGVMFDGLGMYFLFRCVVRSWTDVERIAWMSAVLAIPVAFVFLIEWSTGRNAFAVFGGVPAQTLVREGRLRCQGAFAHAIYAGTFFASMLPLVVGLWAGRKRTLVASGTIAILFIVVACASSTPVFALGFAVLGIALYPYRRHVRMLRWGFLLLLVFLHLVMKAPVWHLLARVSAVGGSTGYHRFRILDATIKNFTEWAILGESNPMSWGIWEMRDITNHYILEALRGGLLSLTLFIAILTVAFQYLGRTIRACEGNRPQQYLAWGVGVSLFVHVGAFFGVSYFGQIMMLFYLSLALAGSLSQMAVPAAVRAGSPSARPAWAMPLAYPGRSPKPPRYATQSRPGQSCR